MAAVAASTVVNSTIAMLIPLNVLAEITSPNLLHRVASEVVVRLIALLRCGCWSWSGKTLEMDMVAVGSKLLIRFIEGTFGSFDTQLIERGSISSITSGESWYVWFAV